MSYDGLIGREEKRISLIQGETLLKLAIKKVKRGSLIYTDKFQNYNGLGSYEFKHRRITQGNESVNGNVYISWYRKIQVL